MDELKEKIKEDIYSIKEELFSISKYIHDNPETGRKEYKASARLEDVLERHGFKIEKGYMGMDTAFKADYENGDGASIALMAEYDALVGMGHACGHNLICTSAVGAAIALQPIIDKMGGRVTVFGTPAEETNGAKVTMSAAGAFDSYDIAIMAHPSDKYSVYSSSLAMDALQFEYIGKAAHAASAPQEGINALDAVLQLFSSINALRQGMDASSRVHGIITDGGQAPNIIPDHAVACFYVRAATTQVLNVLTGRVKNCAKGAELATGTLLKVSNFEYSFDNLVTNRHIAEICRGNLKLLGINEMAGDDSDTGSTDMGNVSHRVPSMHMYFKIVKEGTPGHSIEMREAAGSQEGMNAMLTAACALAMTASDVITDNNLRLRIRDEFERSISK